MAAEILLRKAEGATPAILHRGLFLASQIVWTKISKGPGPLGSIDLPPMVQLTGNLKCRFVQCSSVLLIKNRNKES